MIKKFVLILLLIPMFAVADDGPNCSVDVVLPDKDGFLICKHVKSTSKETVVIMLTGKASQADKIKGSLAGCNDYLIKLCKK